MSAADRKGKGDSPETTEDSALWAMYTQGPVPHEMVDFPVHDSFLLRDALDQIAMVVLSIEEKMLAQAEADAYTRKYMIKNPPKEGEVNTAFDAIYGKETAIRVLYRACRDPRDESLKRRVFPAPGVMRTRLTDDQLSILSNHYVTTERLLSPIKALESTEALEAFIERLRRGGRRGNPLDFLTSEARNDLIWRLVSLLPTSLSLSDSPGAPGEKTDETPEADPSSGAPPEEAPETSSAPEDGPGVDPSPPDKPPPLIPT